MSLINTANNPPRSFEDLSQYLRSRLIESHIIDIEVVNTIDSTNSALMQRSFADEPKPAAMLWALKQMSGRGRRGRVWQSHPENALTFSLSFESEVRQFSNLASLSPAAGLHLAKALSQIASGVQVKWPNDLWRANRKIAGVLLEATQRGKIQRVVFGIGINLYWPTKDALQALNPNSVSTSTPPQMPGGLFDEEVNISTKLEVLHACAKAIAALHQQARNSTTASKDWFTDWSNFDALVDQRVNLFQDQTLIASGTNAGVDHNGAFLLRHCPNGSEPATSDGPLADHALPNHVQRFEIGEVSLRGA